MNSNIELRKSMISKRKVMTVSECVTKSSIICDKIIANECYKKARVVYLYCSTNNEVDLDKVINDAYLKGKTVAFPKVEGKEMHFYCALSKDELKPGYFNILEPDTTYPAPKADLVIVPGTVFTKEGKRIGYGGGFYDRFLSQNKVYSIGVCYDFQIVDDLTTMPHDQVLDEVIFM